MYKLAFNNFALPSILLVLSIAIGIVGVYLNMSAIPLPAWVLLTTVILFLGFSLILFPAGGPQKIVSIAGITLAIYVITVVVILIISSMLGKNPVGEGLSLKISLVSVILPIIMSMLVTKFLVRLEKVEPKSQQPDLNVLKEEVINPIIKEEVTQTPVEPVSKIDPPVVEPKEIQTQQQLVQETVKNIEEQKPKITEEYPKEVFFEDIMEKSSVFPVIEPKTEPEKIKTEPEVFFEDIVDKQTQENLSQTVKKEIPESKPIIIEEPVKAELLQEPQLEELTPLGDLPALDGSLNELPEAISAHEPIVYKEKDNLASQLDSVKSEAHTFQNEKTTTSPINHDVAKPLLNEDTNETETSELVLAKEQPMPYIPALNDSPRSKEVESAGKITSIGKLLVDHRDIENIIETNALMQGISSDATTTKIISAVAGGKTNDKLAALSSLNGVKYSYIVNDAGFIQASTLNDIHKEQVLGALSSGCFGIISNSLKKLGFQPAKDITFETDTCSIIFHRFSSNIITIFIDPAVSLYSFDDINNSLVNAVEREPKDIINTFSSINGIIGVVYSDNSGELIANKLIDESKNPQGIAKVLPAFYNNLSVFTKNLDNSTLKRAVINTGNEMLLFTSLADNLLMLYATLNTAIQPRDIKLQYESLLES